jgi:hypothetical protein
MQTTLKKYSFLSLLLLCSIGVFGQRYHKVTGVVRDSTDNSPMPNATLNINYGQKLMLTDQEGKFNFTIKEGELILVIKYVNYLPFRTRFDLVADTVLNIYIKDYSKDLDQVTVSSRRADKNVKEPIMGVSTLNIKEIKKIPMVLGEVDVLRGVQMLPGVTSVGEASNGVNIRGGTTDQNLMLLDGAPIFNPTHMFGLFSAFPSDVVSGFDLYKGNVPARFSGRTAGVLDVTIANPSTTTRKTQVSIGLVSQKLLFETPIIKDKLSISLSGRLAYNDWMLPLVSDKLDNIGAKFGDGAAKIFYRLNNKNTLSYTGYGSFDNLTTNILGGINNINSNGIKFDYRAQNHSFKWFKLLGNNLNMQTSLVSSVYVPQTILPELNKENDVVIYQDVNFKQAKVNFNYQNADHKVEFGADAAYYKINPGELQPNKSTAYSPITTPLENGLETGVFIDDTYSIGEKIKISAGLRYSRYGTFGPTTVYSYAEDQERTVSSIVDSVVYSGNKAVKNYGGLEPRIGLNISLSEESSLKFGFNMMRQYLQIVSNTTTPIPTSRWKSSDSHVAPQVSKLYTMGYFRNFNDNIYEFSTEIYYKTTDNVIDYKPGASFLLQKNIETELLQGINKAYGLEMMLAKKKGELTGWLNYTYARSLNQINEGAGQFQQVNNGNWYATNYDRPHTVNAAIVLAQTQMHDFSFNLTYSTGRPFTAPSAIILSNGVNYPFYAERNNSRIPSYHRLDFSWNIYNPANKSRKFKGNWNFTVYNLYGRKNAYSVYLKSTERITNAYKMIIFGAPIPSISYNFKFE